MKKIGVFLSHDLAEKQVEYINEKLNISEILYPSTDMKKLWSNIDPHEENIINDIDIFKKWIVSNLSQGDYLIIQGDYGATFNLVYFALSIKVIPVYATTERVVREVINKDGAISIERTFKHVIFRKYE